MKIWKLGTFLEVWQRRLQNKAAVDLVGGGAGIYVYIYILYVCSRAYIHTYAGTYIHTYVRTYIRT